MSFELFSHGSFQYQADVDGIAETDLDIETEDAKFEVIPENGLHFNYHRKVYQQYREIHEEYIGKKGINRRPEDLHIGIIGAGMAGLFSALILKKAGIKVTVFEVNDRVGGRVNTHYFPSEESQRWQYGEFGAMRLPECAEHKLVFDVIKYLNELNLEHPDRHIDLTDFIMNCDNGLTFYNNIMLTNKVAKDYPDRVGFPAGVLGLWNRNISIFLKTFESNFKRGLNFLMKFDSYSVRGFLTAPPVFSRFRRISEEWASYLEVYNSGTGLFNLAFVQVIIEVVGGMQRLPEAFRPFLGDDIKYRHSVQKLEILPENKVGITYTTIQDNQHQFPPLNCGRTKTESFDHVIVTCPLGVVRRWDLPEFSLQKRSAIRCLNYGNSTKIFLQFRTSFWENGPRPIIGGASTTDLPIRKIVYPSYGTNSGEPGVLQIYTWGNDATRFGANSDEDIAELALRDLVKIHGEIVRSEYLGRYGVQYWSTDPIAGGGTFAFFEPGQFTTWVEPLKTPEFNIHFAGEHTDVHHAWIVGALNSAMYATMNIMCKEGLSELFRRVTRPFTSIYNVLDEYIST
ncbi:flavin-containing amine oxidoreductase-domain containing protein [Endogone sp. FLAS-F59071]|nr:flavin-containing amine oxidoreductase-domain containing protein [Endogone sp. FLAS-F59071]|eukprot:RUS15384.1 flavin-containing amine oxidoreductase-domain containing protein [Endogone sp. FLAS-F59071]